MFVYCFSRVSSVYLCVRALLRRLSLLFSFCPLPSFISSAFAWSNLTPTSGSICSPGLSSRRGMGKVDTVLPAGLKCIQQVVCALPTTTTAVAATAGGGGRPAGVSALEVVVARVFPPSAKLTSRRLSFGDALSWREQHSRGLMRGGGAMAGVPLFCEHFGTR